MDFVFDKLAEPITILGKSFTFDPIEEFDVLIKIEKEANGDLLKRNDDYAMSFCERYAIDRPPTPIIAKLVSMIVDFRNDYVADAKKKPTADNG